MALTPKHQAVVTHPVTDKGYAIATDGHGETFFLYARNFDSFARSKFMELRLGSIVKFVAIDGPKGARAVDIEIVAI